MKNRDVVTHFAMKIIRTYRYITCNKNILFVKKYQPIVGIHRLLHSSCCVLHTNTAITRQLIRTARTLEAEWLASLWGGAGTGTKGDESSTGRVWAAGFHHGTARSRLARVLKLVNRLVLYFSKFFFRGRGEPRILNPRIRESAYI